VHRRGLGRDRRSRRRLLGDRLLDDDGLLDEHRVPVDLLRRGLVQRRLGCSLRRRQDDLDGRLGLVRLRGVLGRGRGLEHGHRLRGGLRDRLGDELRNGLGGSLGLRRGLGRGDHADGALQRLLGVAQPAGGRAQG
jgi:hypothetical protein